MGTHQSSVLCLCMCGWHKRTWEMCLRELPSVHSWMVVGFESAADSFAQTPSRKEADTILYSTWQQKEKGLGSEIATVWMSEWCGRLFSLFHSILGLKGAPLSHLWKLLPSLPFAHYLCSSLQWSLSRNTMSFAPSSLSLSTFFSPGIEQGNCTSTVVARDLSSFPCSS